MKNPTMLYRCPGSHITEGIAYDYAIVEDAEVASRLADGWHRNWVEADQAAKEAELQANEQKLAEVEMQLKESGDLRAVHKGRGVYEVQDAEGRVVATGLTKEEAQAQAGS